MVFILKIALLVVLGGDLVRSTEHVGIGYIAAYLREKNYDVTIFEIKDINNTESYKELLQEQYDIVGFTTTCITLKLVLEMADKLKQMDPSIITVCGGHMATFGGADILKDYQQIDYIISGEGEITFYELAQYIELKGDISKIEGLSYRDHNGCVIKNADRHLISDLDSLPLPARDQFINAPKNTQYIRISTSRGCYGGCAFCSSFVGRKQEGARWRGRSPLSVVNEIEYLLNTYNFHTFDFVDSTFEDPGLVGKQRIKEIAQLIIERDMEIYYNCCFRAENWKDEDRDILDLLVQSGLEKVNIGFESGNDRGLRILHKRAKMEDNWKTIKVLRDFPDIYLTFGFIMLHPYSCKEDLYDNATFLHNTGIGQVIRHYFWQLEVYPGTLMEEKLIKDQLLTKDYDIADGMYKYKFQNQEMTYYANAFKSLLELNSVWDFEIFDIVIHTFITRLRRKYKDSDIFSDIEDFRNYVNDIRKEIADFNYDFFLRLYAQSEDYDLEKEKVLLDTFIKETMKLIKLRQYKLGRSVLKMGKSLVNR